MDREKAKEEAIERLVKIYDAEDGENEMGSFDRLCSGVYDAGWDARDRLSAWVAIKSENDLPKKDGGYLTTCRNGDGSLAVAELYLVTRDWEEPIRRVWEAGGDGWPQFDNVIAWAHVPAPFTVEENKV